MSDEDLVAEQEVQVVFQQEIDSSSEEPPIEEWSSLIFEAPEDNVKKLLYAENLYDPGSGEVCLKYIVQSDSSVLRHPYYKYPAVTDPGIIKAILQPEDKKIYSDDGQELYLAICKEMGVCPVKIFYRGLLEPEIDLKYYGVNPNSVRAMATALKNNRIVSKIDYTDNFLNDDSCYHLGQMFKENINLSELNLSGCRIGPSGLLRLLDGLKKNRFLTILNLNKNQLGDPGMQILSDTMMKGLPIRVLGLSYNSISAKGVTCLTEALEFHTKLTELDLSWNKVYVQAVTGNLIKALIELPNFQVLNLAWNSLTGTRIANSISSLLMENKITHLDLSFNKFDSETVPIIISNLTKAKKLHTLNLSDNLFTPKDALLILNKMKFAAVKVKNLLLDNINVSPEFVKQYERIMELKFRKDTNITYGKVIVPHTFADVDFREIVMNRADYLGNKPKSKKKKVDVVLLFLDVIKEWGRPIISVKDFQAKVKERGCNLLDGDLLDEIANAFPGPKNPKVKLLQLSLLADYMKRKWPDRKLPPTPPPEPVVVVQPDDKGKKGKGKEEKGKGKKK